ncbi:hypothetical protein P8452_17969 [Trifolium repens]|nr:hypothetical protein P8452_17969 [Trifolium repens]
MEATLDLRNDVELATSVSDKHRELLKPSAGNYSIFRGQAADIDDDHDRGKYSLIRDSEDFQIGIYDKPLPCFGCGIGWFSERAGLGASAIASLIASVALLLIGAILLLHSF